MRILIFNFYYLEGTILVFQTKKRSLIEDHIQLFYPYKLPSLTTVRTKSG